MTAYDRGNAYEVKTCNVLTADGYVCWQARGSKGVADVIALKRGQVLLVQVKSGQTAMPLDHLGLNHAGWNGLFELATQLGAVPVACYWARWVRRPLWRQLTGLHTEHRQLWPSVPWTPDEVAA